MRESIRNRYSISIELLFNKYVEVWVELKKTKFVGNIFFTVEEFYYDHPPWFLELIRLNRFSKLYVRVSIKDVESFHRAINELTKGMQHTYICMNFQETLESWIRNSYNMQLLQQCQSFIDTQYFRQNMLEVWMNTTPMIRDKVLNL